jgi:hypothetical protein
MGHGDGFAVIAGLLFRAGRGGGDACAAIGGGVNLSLRFLDWFSTLEHEPDAGLER